ncbi:MAG: TrmH family RNA methyltransferase, partial [Pseudomonadota bacterium]
FSAKGVKRAAMDYGVEAEVVGHATWAQFRSDRPEGRLVLLTTKASVPLWDHDFAQSDILLLGRESAGVPDEVHGAADARIRIPMPGGGRSLNVAMAAGIAAAEALRQLGGQPR